MIQIRISSYKDVSSTSLRKRNVIHNCESQLINAAQLGTSTPKSSKKIPSRRPRVDKGFTE